MITVIGYRFIYIHSQIHNLYFCLWHYCIIFSYISWSPRVVNLWDYFKESLVKKNIRKQKPPLSIFLHSTDCDIAYIFMILNGIVDGLQNRFEAESKRSTANKEIILCHRRNINIPHSFAQQKGPCLCPFLVRNVISVCLGTERCFIGLYVPCLWEGGNV